jgi:hypothetical protein
MGMSASQIRYCMLQARKSDIEFQGQQINQQRTTLATQSAAYNTELLTMTVPTPPSTEEFTTTTYSYTYNGSEYEIKATNYMNKEYTVGEGLNAVTYPAGTYVIDYTTKQVQDMGSRGSKYSISKEDTKDEQGNVTSTVYSVLFNNQVYELTPVDESQSTTVEEIIHSNNVGKVIKRDFEDVKDSKFYQVEISKGQYAYFLEEDLQNYFAKDGLDYQSPVQSYLVSPQSVSVPGKLYGAQITWTDTGRMSTIADSKGRVCGLDVNTVADDNAYADAYNEYLYQKDQYNKKMDDINSQLEVIQAQDKKLELQLRNLDTQESAIKTEMDAVKSVCKDNIDKSFNVFG